eukprot:TRINITY_DN30430_c0_g1_i1.p1 TRINITY_DN30430_c0_g1~~TRINITY_DN30430_c0_g1_i1.p1  ORF type:complete len:784 (+),score=165.87 TRINITY_DN30430_c0_g1_i1:68-2419(+)
MLGRCWWAFADCVAKPLLCDGDTEESVRVKRTVVPLLFIIVPFLIYGALTELENRLYSFAVIAAVSTCLVTYVGWYVRPLARMEMLLVAGLEVALIMTDYSDMSTGSRLYALAVILFDACLVLNMPDTFTLAIVSVFLVYLNFSMVDMATLQLYLELSPRDTWICECAEPPCVLPASRLFNFCAVASFVLLIDLYFTRGFANAMRYQMSVVQRAILVTEQIAHHLSLYEVEEGRATLQGEQGEALPPVLKKALHRLLDNLNEYKPYLPDAMLVQEDGLDASTVEPPGFGQHNPTVALVFTDIECSTELWENHPQATHTALQQHNSTIRRLVKEHKGYEVKVIGDAFMLAFKYVEDACRFGLEVQEALVDVRWPSELQLHPLCRHTVGAAGRTIWNGPRLRIGINCGEVRVDKNPVTGRCDYFGPPVNTAARVESCLRGGLTGVTRAVMSKLPPGALSRLGDPRQVSLGMKDLKGVAVPVEVFVLLKQRLAEREDMLHAPHYTPTVRGVRRRSKDSSLGSVELASSISSLPRSPMRELHSPARHFRVTDLRLGRRVATSATFRARSNRDLGPLANSVEQMLEVVEMAADATQGVVVGTVSAQCFVVWNGPRSCLDHLGQCLRALDTVRTSSSSRVVAGACSGEAVYGNMATCRKKHATVVGGCAELSAVLAEAAELDGEDVLAVTLFAKYCATQQRTATHATWDIRGCDTRLTVWAVIPAVQDEDWHSRADTGRTLPLPPLADGGLQSVDEEGLRKAAARSVVFGPGMSLCDGPEQRESGTDLN